MAKINKNTRPELVFWLDAPPRSVAGALCYTAREWGNKVYYICVRPLAEERKAMGWEEHDYGDAILTILSEQADPDRYIKDFVQEHRNAIHVCNGFRSLAAPFVKRWLFSIPDVKIAEWSERPGVYENVKEKLIKWLLISLLYRYYTFRYRSFVKAYLPIGMLSLEAFAQYGWKREALFPFIYDTHISDKLLEPYHRDKTGPLRFLYVGQFTWRKGVDLLVRAFDKKLKGNWHLSLAGGNGEYEQNIVDWASKHSNISYMGVWPSNEVVQRVSEYDVCLVPSRFDGWGLFTNEAIHAGVGVIVTDTTASNDLVKASGAGMVIPSGDEISLRNSIQYVLNNPCQVEVWKEKAREYAPRITSASIGRYLVDVLDYTFIDNFKPRPKCPWL